MFSKKLKLYFILILLILDRDVLKNKEINLLGKNLYPESISINKQNNSFYVTSSSNGTIQEVDLKGNIKIIDLPKEYNVKRAYGIKYDNKKNRLWFVDGESVYTYNINNKSIKKNQLKEIILINRSVLNDLVIDSKGNAYITDSFAPYIYFVDSQTLKMSIFKKLDNVLFAKKNNISQNFNGIILDNKEEYLICVKTNDGTLWKISLKSKKLSEIKISEPLIGGDGLALNKDNILYIIRAFDNKVSMINLSKNKDIFKVISFSPRDIVFPTSINFFQVNNKNYLAVLNSQFRRPYPKRPFTFTLVSLD